MTQAHPNIHAYRLTPQMRGVLERMERAGRPRLHTLTPEQAREVYALGADILEVPRAELERVQMLAIPARDGTALGARLVAPSRATGLPVLLYLHGGGFTIGSSATHDILCRELARLASCMVVSLDYRLAPEHRFPTASNDAWDALTWLAAHPPGDHASALALARDAGLPLALQLLFYPGCAAHQDTASHAKFSRGLVLDEAAISWFFGQYVQGRSEREDWRFAPLLAPDVEGVAPAWIGLAECDPLVDEGIDYADKLRAAGVPVDLEIYRGVTHEFIKMGRAIPEARTAHADAAAALRAAFNLP